MPTYDYRCPNGHTFELFQRMTDAPAEVCEVCGAGPVERIFSPVAVHFKGSGFYTTDYGRGAKKKESKDGDGGAGEKKSDEKTASSAPAAPTPASGSSTSSPE